MLIYLMSLLLTTVPWYMSANVKVQTELTSSFTYNRNYLSYTGCSEI